MATADVRSIVLTFAVIALIGAIVYVVNPSMFAFLTQQADGFNDINLPGSNGEMAPDGTEVSGTTQEEKTKRNPNAMDGSMPTPPGSMDVAQTAGFKDKDASGNEGFADLEDVTGPAAFSGAEAPAGCYPRDQLTPGELLPKDASSVWAQQNPMGTGSLKGKNFLSAGALVGVNTVGQTLRNANWQLRSEPANPQVAVSVFNQSTIAPDTNRRDLEIS